MTTHGINKCEVSNQFVTFPGVARVLCSTLHNEPLGQKTDRAHLSQRATHVEHTNEGTHCRFWHSNEQCWMHAKGTWRNRHFKHLILVACHKNTSLLPLGHTILVDSALLHNFKSAAVLPTRNSDKLCVCPRKRNWPLRWKEIRRLH